ENRIADSTLPHRAEQSGGIPYFRRSDGEPRQLPALDERFAARIENFAARRRQRGRKEVLPLSLLRPFLAVHDLNFRELGDERRGENHQHAVNDGEAVRAWHAAPGEGESRLAVRPARAFRDAARREDRG